MSRSAGRRASLTRWWHALESRQRRVVAGVILRAALAVVAVAAAVGGLWRLQAYVLNQPAFARSSARVDLADIPAWMSDRLAASIRQQLERGLEGKDWTFDPTLARRVHQAAQRCPWVRTLHEVRVEREPAGPGDSLCSAGRVLVRADWRRPVAVGVWGDLQECIDADGVVLPRDQAGSLTTLTRISGMAAGPPAVGQAWSGADLAAGLSMIALLRDKPYRAEITLVDVGNFDRRDWKEPAILLVAAADRRVTDIHFGELPTDGMPPVGEPSLQRKLGYLDQWYRQNQRQLAGPEYLDLRFSKLRIAGSETPSL